MLKRREDGKVALVGSADGELIKPGQRATVGRYAKRMKRRPTEAERALLEIADRIRQFSGNRLLYRRQREFFVATGVSFIVDLYFKAPKIAIEADGESHRGELARARDGWRTMLLAKHEGVLVMRFENSRLLNEPAECMREIVSMMRCQFVRSGRRGYIRFCDDVLGRVGAAAWRLDRDMSGYHLRI